MRETPEWKKLMKDGAFNQTFMTGADYAKWVANEEKRHEDLMKDAGFLAKQLTASTQRRRRTIVRRRLRMRVGGIVMSEASQRPAAVRRHRGVEIGVAVAIGRVRR